MIFSNPSIQKDDLQILRKNLESIGIREIGIWKELVLRDESLFSEIYSLMYCDNRRLAWHAAWVIDHVSEASPEKLERYVPEMIEELPKLKSSALRRHFTRMLLSQRIPENQMGHLVNDLYDLLTPAEDIAVRANALQLLYNLSLSVPELQPELISVIETILEDDLTPGMLSKARRILSSLGFNDVKIPQRRGLKQCPK